MASSKSGGSDSDDKTNPIGPPKSITTTKLKRYSSTTGGGTVKSVNKLLPGSLSSSSQNAGQDPQFDVKCTIFLESENDRLSLYLICRSATWNQRRSNYNPLGVYPSASILSSHLILKIEVFHDSFPDVVSIFKTDQFPGDEEYTVKSKQYTVTLSVGETLAFSVLETKKKKSKSTSVITYNMIKAYSYVRHRFEIALPMRTGSIVLSLRVNEKGRERKGLTSSGIYTSPISETPPSKRKRSTSSGTSPKGLNNSGTSPRVLSKKKKSKKMERDPAEEKAFATALIAILSRYSPELATDAIVTPRIEGDVFEEIKKYQSKLFGLEETLANRPSDRFAPVLECYLSEDPHPLKEKVNNLLSTLQDFISKFDFLRSVPRISNFDTDLIFEEVKKVCIDVETIFSALLPKKSAKVLGSSDLPTWTKLPIMNVPEITELVKRTKALILLLKSGEKPVHEIKEAPRQGKPLVYFVITLLTTLQQQREQITNITGNFLTVHKSISGVKQLFSPSLLSALSLAGVLVELLRDVVRNVETINSVMKNPPSSKRSKKSHAEENLRNTLESALKEPVFPLIIPEDMFRPGTVPNMLVRIIQAPPSVLVVQELIRSLLAGFKVLVSIDQLWDYISAAWSLPSDSKIIRSHAAHYKIRLGELIAEFVEQEIYFIGESTETKIKSFAEKNTFELGPFHHRIRHQFKKEFLAPVASPQVVQYWDLDEASYYSLIGHFDCIDVAQQLTLIDWKIYQSITEQEVRQMKFESPLEAALACRMSYYTARLNNIAHWVATTILLHETEERRALTKRHFVGIAKCLLELQNFGSFVAIIAGLNIAPVTRLKKTEACFLKTYPSSHEDLEEFTKLQDPKGSFAALRAVMSRVGSQALPYAGTTVAELILIDEGNPSKWTISDITVCNYPKFHMIWKSIDTFQQFQKICDFGSFKPVEPLFSALCAVPSVSYKELFGLSQLREPRAPNSDKEKKEKPQ